MSWEDYPGTTPSGYTIEVIRTVEDLSKYASKKPDYDLFGMADELERGRSIVRNAQSAIEEQVDSAISDAKVQLDREKLIADIEQDHEDIIVGRVSETYNLDNTDTNFLRETFRLINKYRENGVDLARMGQELASEAKKDIPISKSSDGKVIGLNYHFAFRNFDAIEGPDLHPASECSVIDLASYRQKIED